MRTFRSTGCAVRFNPRRTAGHTNSFQTLFCTHSRKIAQASPCTPSEKKASKVAAPLAYAFSQNMSVLPRSGQGLPKRLCRLCRLQAPSPSVKTQLNYRGTSASSGSVTSEEMRQTPCRNGHVVEASDAPELGEQQLASAEEKTTGLRCEAEDPDPRRAATAGRNAGLHQPMQKPKQWSRQDAQQRNAISRAVVHRHVHHFRQCQRHARRPQMTIEAPTCQGTELCDSAAEVKWRRLFSSSGRPMTAAQMVVSAIPCCRPPPRRRHPNNP